MGRGGGGGGSRGGSFGGGSRGGSYRSSGGSRGSSFSSGRSRSSSSGSGHSTHNYYHRSTYVGNSFGGGYAGHYSGRGNTFLQILVTIAVCLVLAIAVSNIVQGGNVTKSTIDREPLDKKYVTVGNGPMFEDSIGWVRSPKTVEKGLKYFYEKTGVMPYLVITTAANMGEPYGVTGEDCWNYANKIYDEKFTDEGHMVFVFQSEDQSDYYNMAACTGMQAKVVIDDDEALEILYDYFDANWSSDKSEDDMFADSFIQAADRIMKKTPDYTAVIMLAFAGLGTVIVVLLIIKQVHKRKKEEAEETERILNTPTDQL